MTKFWGIGVGPGDSELLTVKAVQTIKKLDVLYTPQAHKGGASVAEKIAAPYLPDDLEIKRRHFPMVRDWEVKRKSWKEIADEIATDVQSGKEVGFLTLGDPSVYSTYSYLVELLEGKIEVETLAGISAFSQIAASLSVPLMLDEESLEVVPATIDADKLGQIIDVNDNVVIMKIAVDFRKIYQILKIRKLLDSTVVVERASMDGQVVKTMSEYSEDAELPYFATALMKRGDSYATS